MQMLVALESYKNHKNYAVRKRLTVIGREKVCWVRAQSRQSARLSFQSSELAPPASSPRRRVLPPHFGSMGGQTRLREMDGGSQFGRRDIHSATIL
jgi:hypothetical protein